MKLDTKRIKELDKEIEEAEDRYYAAQGFGTKAHNDTPWELAFGSKAIHTAYLRTEALHAAVDMLRAKRGNVKSGLPEDFGIEAPINLNALIGDRMEAMERCIEGIRNEHVSAHNRFTKSVEKQFDKALKFITKELDSARSMTYVGTWQKAGMYRRNNAVTHDGSLWIAVKDAPESKPGSSDEWQLAVKAGRDGRDSR